MSDKSIDNFASVFFRQIFDYCYEWICSNPTTHDVELDYNISMLRHLCHPARWKTREPNKNEIDAITTLLGSVIEPCFRTKAPELWNKIDRAGLTFAIYTIPTFKAFGSDFTIIEDDGKDDQVPPPPSPPPPTPSPQVTKKVEKVEGFDEDEKVEVVNRGYIHPLVEVENLDDEDEDEDDDEDDENDVIEVPDTSDRTIEIMSTPERKRAKLETPSAPRVLRKKIIIQLHNFVPEKNPETTFVPKK